MAIRGIGSATVKETNSDSLAISFIILTASFNLRPPSEPSATAAKMSECLYRPGGQGP